MVSNPFTAPTGQRCELVACRACPRLAAWREGEAARVPPRFRDFVARYGFWARPVPAFGDPNPWLVIVGLAPAAQGANRTGRMFTRDRSGDFLFAALHRAGLASAPRSEHRGDGLRLFGVLITAPLRCAPPQNRPLREELNNCRDFLRADLAGCPDLRVILALGGVAHATVLRLLREDGMAGSTAPFRHASSWPLPGAVWLVDSYHVSQQNTFTRRLTPTMFDGVLQRCLALRAYP